MRAVAGGTLAVVTGAAGGLGSAFARALAARGHRLLLTDRDAVGLQTIADELGAEAIVADLSREAEVERLSVLLAEREVGIIVNNAGFGTFSMFADAEWSAQRDMVAVHVLAAMRLCRAVLPGMIKRDAGAIINVSSAEAFQRWPRTATYVGTKAFLVAFTECLAVELAATSVRVQALCPAWVRTGFVTHGDFAKVGYRSPIPGWWYTSSEHVVDQSLAALERGRIRVVPTRLAQLIVPLLGSHVGLAVLAQIRKGRRQDAIPHSPREIVSDLWHSVSFRRRVPDIRYRTTRAAIVLGPNNWMVQVALRLACRRHGVELRFRGPVIDLVRDRRVMRVAAQHFGYTPTLAATFDLYHEQVEPTSVGRLQIVDYSRPRLQQYRRSGLEFEITSFPEEEETVHDYFRWYHAKPGDLVFDIGAHCGVSTYALSRAVGEGGRVVAFEPDPANYELLLRNIARHGLNNVTALRIAVAPTQGEADFYAEGTFGSVLATDSARSTMGSAVTIDTLTLADACRRFGTPAFVKMDIEGSEVRVLEASRDLLLGNPITFALDTNHWVRGQRTTQTVERIFTECGYEVFSSDESGSMTTWARSIRDDGRPPRTAPV